MTSPLFSSSWHRVASLVPRLRSHVQIHRHQYRGEIAHVLQDHASQRSHRFTPLAYHIIGLMDGQRTVQEIWDLVTAHLSDPPTQEELIRLLSQLHAADALQCNVSPDTAELLRRYQHQKRMTGIRRFLNPMALRFRLVDPDSFLDRILPFVRPLFGWIGGLVWVLVVGLALFLAGTHWPELTKNMTDRVLAPHNLLLMGLVFPFVKIVHEFGHAIATKIWGGEVHEMGVMFLVLMPIPYVDASSSSAFREKAKRMIVGAAGMIAEVFLAALALFVWLNAEPGVIHAVTYNVMFIASVSTVLFNANPLLRFDGYYILADLIEIQNLGMRSTKYLGYLCQRYLFGLSRLEPPPSTPGERVWFVGYGIASFVYRLFVAVAIALFIAGRFFFVGVLLAVWGIIMTGVVPLVKGIAQILTNSTLRPKRARAIVATVSTILLVLGTIIFVPVPSWTRAEGVMWVPGESVVRANADGFIDTFVAQPGSYVSRGDPLIASHNMAVVTRVHLLIARVEELEARYSAELMTDRVQAKITEEEMHSVSADLERAREEARDLIIRSEADGTFIVPKAQDLSGRFVRKGETIGYTLGVTTTAKVIVAQNDIDMVRQRTRRIEIRPADRIQDRLPAVIRREAPAATDELPSLVLSQQGGGNIPLDLLESKRAKAFQKFFLLDLDVPTSTAAVHIGGRVYVRFDHGYEPLATQWYRNIRRLFLARFNV